MIGDDELLFRYGYRKRKTAKELTVFKYLYLEIIIS